KRCLERDVKQRLRDVGDVRADIDEALSTDKTSTDARFGSHARFWRMVGIGSFAAFLVVSIVAIWLLMRTRPSPATFSSARTIAAQLTDYGGTETAAALSPDGRSFVFVSGHGDTQDVWLRQVAGGEPVRLTNDAALETDLAFAPNGESIYFTRADS